MMFYEREDINQELPVWLDDIYDKNNFDEIHKMNSWKPCNIFVNTINWYSIKVTRYYQYPNNEIIERVDVYIKKPNTQWKAHEFGVIMHQWDCEPVMRAIKEIVWEF